MAYNILVVDDSSIARKALKKTVAMTDVPIGQWIEAEHGQAGLQQLDTAWVDMVILDINMPVMNGIEFMRALKAHPTHHSTPVVVISTEGSKERIEELEQLGIRAYLRKPVTPEAVVDVVGKILGGGGDDR